MEDVIYNGIIARLNDEAAHQAGDLEKVVQIEGELAETELTLTELRSLNN